MRGFGSSLRAEAANNKDRSSAHTPQISALATVSFTYSVESHMDASSQMSFLSHASLKVDKTQMIDMDYLVLKKCTFICDITFITILAIKLEILSPVFQITVG